MLDTIIRVENLGKKYIIGHQQEGRSRYTALRDVIANSVNSLVKTLQNPQSTIQNNQEEFWALKEVSFEVKRGEAVGIIGRNGAGKSTLLKILSRITEPTTGRVTLKGRVASLLEVGTGFHPELTGRENIYLNGAILGMSKAEIKRKFDEIVDFAEVEKFLDTPVKHYSSGMYVRLAFAVAAHLEPEILVVDEVLAVGDAAFQKKCLGKMKDVSTQEGRTVLFVSHQMSMISSLCSKAILLESGKVSQLGFPADVILRYYSSGHSSPAQVDFTKMNKYVGDDYAVLLEGYIKNSKGQITTDIDINESITIGMRYRILVQRSFNLVYPYPNCNVFASDGTHIFYSSVPNSELSPPVPGEYKAEFSIPGNLLNSGTYFIGLAFSCCDAGVKVHFYEQNALCFNIKENIEITLYNNRNGWSGVLPGIIHPQFKWNHKKMVTNS
jgi:lipopolysaccharide transport system ATP-binding protein